ncbi:TPA: hypothetical protein ACF367_004423 [Vibrio parahaemolyticus]|uniref:hypothetical protein n=1 Tax=Vibrio parahaemolyticus TaxID=670 RepID=UPI00111FC815|nr:hypothetical protein [Vibrio parahaemolyticus]TOM68635.1 hypothetical protein CGH71_22840 [Vibrio parahaemolyticus]TOM94536.1 hypothetical protein CGH65_24385 [Vibrio parahaemolyticus]
MKPTFFRYKTNPEPKPRSSTAKQVALIATISGTISAITATGISAYQAHESAKQYQLQRTSNLGIYVDQYDQKYAEIEEHKAFFEPYHYNKKARVTFSNNGFAKTSVVKLELYVSADLPLAEGQSKQLRIYFPSFRPVLTDISGNIEVLPINLDGGESKSVIFEYPVDISQYAYNHLPDYLKDGKVSWKEIDRNLSMVYKEHSPLYELIATKADGTRISIHMTHFDSGRNRKGETPIAF